MNGMGKEKNGLEKAKIIPCILKQDALERHLESDIKKALSAHGSTTLRCRFQRDCF